MPALRAGDQFVELTFHNRILGLRALSLPTQALPFRGIKTSRLRATASVCGFEGQRRVQQHPMSLSMCESSTPFEFNFRLSTSTQESGSRHQQQWKGNQLQQYWGGLYFCKVLSCDLICGILVVGSASL